MHAPTLSQNVCLGNGGNKFRYTITAGHRAQYTSSNNMTHPQHIEEACIECSRTTGDLRTRMTASFASFSGPASPPVKASQSSSTTVRFRFVTERHLRRSESNATPTASWVYDTVSSDMSDMLSGDVVYDVRQVRASFRTSGRRRGRVVGDIYLPRHEMLIYSPPTHSPPPVLRKRVSSAHTTYKNYAILSSSC